MSLPPWYKETLQIAKEEGNEHSLVLATKNALKNIEDDLPEEEFVRQAKMKFVWALSKKSKRTVQSYIAAVRLFGIYIDVPVHMFEEGADIALYVMSRIACLSQRQAESLVTYYLAHLRDDKELANKTINAYLAALKFFAELSRKIGYMNWNLNNVEGLPDENKKDVRGPTPDEFRLILQEIENTKNPLRNKLIIYMLAFMGLRIESLLSIDIEEIDFDKRRILAYAKGKGKKKRWFSVPKGTFKLLLMWIKEIDKFEGPLFPGTGASGRLSARGVRAQLFRVGQSAGIELSLHPHAFRHFTATEGLDITDGNIYAVKKLTGHAQSKTLELYDDERKDVARGVSQTIEDKWNGKGSGGCDDYMHLFSRKKKDDRRRKRNTKKVLESYEEECGEEGEERWEEDEGGSDYDGVEDEEYENDDDDEDGKKGRARSRVMTAEAAARAAEDLEYIKTGISGIDSVLGGEGMAVGGIYLIHGPPGVGKSTLLNQACASLASRDNRVLYASAEEGAERLGQRVARLGLLKGKVKENLYLLSETEISEITDIAEDLDVDLLIIDSISAVYKDDVNGVAGNTNQVKSCAQYLTTWSHDKETTVFLVGHVDKDNKVAGPRFLEHIVDVVVNFDGDPKSNLRTLSISRKNRFGDSFIIAHFKMTDKGLIEVDSEEDSVGWSDGD